jgi:uncharacterized protein
MKVAADPPDLQSVKEAVKPVCQRHLVSRLEVFGSLATGTNHSGSDIDFLVEFLPSVSAGLLEMGGLKEDLEECLGLPIDLLSRSGVEHSRYPDRRRSILRAPVTVYEQ